MEPTGKIALVTGSTDGVGRMVAQRLGEAGARVLVHGRDHDRGNRVVANIIQAGGTAEFLAADLASLAEVRRFADTVRQRTDRLDIGSTTPVSAPPAHRGRPASTATSCASPSTTWPASC